VSNLLSGVEKSRWSRPATGIWLGTHTHLALRWACSDAGSDSRRCGMHVSQGSLYYHQTSTHSHLRRAGTPRFRIRMTAQGWGIHAARRTGAAAR
jgi:hypothetical protein